MSSSHAEAVKPAPIPFSYAQAARGASNSTSTQPSKASSGAVTPAKEHAAGSAALKSDLNGTRWADVDDDDNQTTHSTASTAVENKPSLNVKPPVAHSQAQANGVASPASIEFGASSTSTLAREDGHSPVSELPESAWETKSKASADTKIDTTRTRPSTDRDSSKGRKKSTKRNDKKEKLDTEEKPATNTWTPPIKLVEAPAPAVNPWLARVQTAKAAVAPIPKPAAVPVVAQAVANTAKSNTEDAPKSATTANTPTPTSTSEKSSDVVDGPRDVSHSEDVDVKGIVAPHAEKVTEKTEQHSKVATSVVDAKSWPTPETAKADDHKSKSQEKAEGDAHTSNENKGKQAWNKLDFTPSVVFQTALPTAARRGGKGGGRGAHEGRTRTSASGPSERGADSKTGAQAGDAGRRERPEAARSTSPGRTKRPSQDEGPGRRQSRQESLTRDMTSKQADEAKFKPRDSAESASTAQRTKPVRKEHPVVNGEKRTHEDATSKDSVVQKDGKTIASETVQAEPPATTAVESQKPEPSSSVGERKNSVAAEFSSRNHERKSSGSYSNFSNRGRPDRGRGGHRGGRNSGHTFHPNAHSFVNGQGAFNIQGYGGIPKSPTGFGQDAFFAQGPENSTRRYGRGFPSRAASIPDGSFGRVPNGYPAQPLQLNTSVQGNGTYPADYYMPATAIPFPTDPASDLLNAVTRQMEYYFSMDNLLKDTYLRKHMDSQGFVLLTFIADFKRLKMMTQDLELIKYVCQQSSTIEHRVGSDGVDRLRAAKGWELWVMEKEARDPTARHDGPDTHFQPPRPMPQLPELSHFTRHSSLPIPQSAGPVLGGQAYQSLNSFATPYNSFTPNLGTDTSSASQFQTSPTSMISGPSMAQSSAATLGGSPNQPQLFSNGVEETEPDSFTDSEVEVLRVVLRDLPGEVASPTGSTTNHPPFSNGSLEGVNGQRSPSFPTAATTQDETDKVASPTSSERANRFMAGGGSSSKLASPRNGSRNGDVAPADTSNGVYYIKDKDSPSYDLPADVTSELYLAARDRAIQQRNFHPCPHDMLNMYQFWEHFLVRHFNARMYMEFRSFAMEDASTRNEFSGLNALLRYYGKALAYAEAPMRRSVAQDYVSLVRSEQQGGSSNDRPAFKQLRAAWRDGALNMKNRKRVKDFLDEAMERELDR